MKHTPFFKEMLREEQLALFTAWLNGEIIETLGCNGWVKVQSPLWNGNSKYRTQPTKSSVNWDHVSEDIICMATNKNKETWGYSEHPNPGVCSWRATYDGRGVRMEVFSSFNLGTCDWQDSLVIRPRKE